MGGDHLPPRPLVIAGFNQVRGRPHSKWNIVKQFNHLYSNGYSGRLWWLYREVNLLPSRSIHFGRIINFFQYYKSKNGKHGKNPKINKFLGTFLYIFFFGVCVRWLDLANECTGPGYGWLDNTSERHQFTLRKIWGYSGALWSAQ